MEDAKKMKLPKVLMLDDQFGRCGLGGKFRKAVSADVFAGYEADRQNLCLNFGLIDVTGDAHFKKPSAPLAEAIFCPSQVWNDADKRIENSYETALRMVRRGWPFDDGERWALVLVDLRFVYGSLNAFGDPQEGSLFGVDVLLPKLRAEFGEDLPIVVLSSTKREDNNPTVRRLGALDFIQRIPGAGTPPEQARETLKRALFQHGLLEDTSETVIGRSLPVLKTLRQARRASRSARNILLLGQTGTGKGLLAEYIHSVSSRARGPFEAFHAAHRPAELQSDELFGHWRGAFTGALSDSAGVWERADGGTLFIDEVADIDLKVQQTLMQPIEERRVKRMGASGRGGDAGRKLDVLVILATNKNLALSASAGSIKTDFLNRINAFTIEVPSLHERKEDIPTLVKHLAKTIAPSWGGSFLPDAINKFRDHSWQEGNVRELRNVIERVITNNPDQDITGNDIDFNQAGNETNKLTNGGVTAKRRAMWQVFVERLSDQPEKLSLSEVEQVKRELKGGLPDLIAHILAWALEIHRTNGKLNPTATVRFLLGRENLSTMEAKQFLKKALTLDTRGKMVAKNFQAVGIAAEHSTLTELLNESLEETSASSQRAAGKKKAR
jgi:two-component system nitrogen regulation response regulator NtrX